MASRSRWLSRLLPRRYRAVPSLAFANAGGREWMPFPCRPSSSRCGSVASQSGTVLIAFQRRSSLRSFVSRRTSSGTASRAAAPEAKLLEVAEVPEERGERVARLEGVVDLQHPEPLELPEARRERRAEVAVLAARGADAEHLEIAEVAEVLGEGRHRDPTRPAGGLDGELPQARQARDPGAQLVEGVDGDGEDRRALGDRFGRRCAGEPGGREQNTHE